MPSRAQSSPLICLCFKISEAEVQTALQAGARSLKAIKKKTGAGAGCTACRPLLEEFLIRARQEEKEKMSGSRYVD